MCINVHVRHITAEVTCIAIAVISSVPSEVMEENPKVVRAMFSALSWGQTCPNAGHVDGHF